MDIGLVGLGKMGGNMRERLRDARATPSSATTATPTSATSAVLEEMVEQLPSPKVVWVMVPAGDPTRADRSRRSATCSARATSSSTAATPAGPTTRRNADDARRRRASASSTAASPAGSGAWRTATP